MIHWSYYLAHHSEPAGLTEHWNDFLKAQLSCELGHNTLCREDTVLWEDIYFKSRASTWG